MRWVRRIAGMLLLALWLPAATAGERTPRPAIVIDKPGQCVADTATMRRDHMKLLMHQRERTMHEGIRTRQHSLNGCIECHASSKTGSVLGENGFCQSCHSYAGVSLDCFECHQARVKAVKPANLPTPVRIGAREER